MGEGATTTSGCVMLGTYVLYEWRRDSHIAANASKTAKIETKMTVNVHAVSTIAGAPFLNTEATGSLRPR
jgi:hypothetical protein